MNLYPSYLQRALDPGAGAIDMNTDDIRCLLLGTYTYDAADTTVTDVLAGPSAVEIARSTALQSPTVVNGTFDAANLTVSAVPNGFTITDLVIYKYNASDASALIIAHIDQDQSAVALSLATNGSDILLSFSGSGIFTL
jgi:hypothetical protein